MIPKPHRYYEVHLPVFKQGDDLANCLGRNENVSHKALRDLAASYESAASQCRLLADACEAHSLLQVEGCTHHIGIHGSESILEELVNLHLVQADDYDCEGCDKCIEAELAEMNAEEDALDAAEC